ncbi:MAG: hypothetical protein ACNI27_11455 [Desulfovibrio sp.]
MPLTNYSENVERMQKGLGKAFSVSPMMLNLPGRSIALKLDTNYYFAIVPDFFEALGKYSALLPRNVATSLVKTGNIVLGPSEKYIVKVHFRWETKRVDMTGCFVEADFIDRALRLYGGLSSSLEISEAKIAASSKEDIAKLFEGKTPLQGLAFSG